MACGGIVASAERLLREQQSALALPGLPAASPALSAQPRPALASPIPLDSEGTQPRKLGTLPAAEAAALCSQAAPAPERRPELRHLGRLPSSQAAFLRNTAIYEVSQPAGHRGGLPRSCPAWRPAGGYPGAPPTWPAVSPRPARFAEGARGGDAVASRGR